jgi:hypothetical protein
MAKVRCGVSGTPSVTSIREDEAEAQIIAQFKVTPREQENQTPDITMVLCYE